MTDPHATGSRAAMLNEAKRRARADGAALIEIRQIAAGVDAALERVQTLEAALERLADLHHRTLTGSRKHDPERQPDFRACPCLTCKAATEALGV